MTPDEADLHESLLQFLYMAPVGLVQLAPDGEVQMMNPLCAQWLMPLSPHGDLGNLFAATAGIAPDLHTRVSQFGPDSGTVVDALPLHLGAGVPGRDASARVLSLTLLKLNPVSLMAVLSDVTTSVARERELQQSRAWIQSFVLGDVAHGMTTLDENGRMQGWTPAFGDVTGFTAAAAVGRGMAVLHPPDTADDDSIRERACARWMRRAGACARAGCNARTARASGAAASSRHCTTAARTTPGRAATASSCATSRTCATPPSRCASPSPVIT